MKFEVGNTVRMNPKGAKWYLDHPEIYFVPSTGRCDPEYDTDMQLHLTCCLGEPVFGRIVDANTEYFKVAWKVGPFKAEYWVSKENMELV